MSLLANVTEKSQRNFAEAFEASAIENAKKSNDLLVPYKPDIHRFPYQSISIQPNRRRVHGTPLPPEDAFKTISFLDPRCSELHLALKDETNEALTAISENLSLGNNIAIGTDHLLIQDVAYLGVGISSEITSLGQQHKSGLVLSKAASDYMGVNLEKFISESLSFDVISRFITGLGLKIEEVDGLQTVPVRDFLSIGFHLQYLVIPNSGSFANLRETEKEVISLHNGMVKKDINKDAGERGIRRNQIPLVLYYVASGTKIKYLDVNEYWEGYKIPGNYHTIPEHLDTKFDEVAILGKIPEGVTDYTSEMLTFAATMRVHDDRTRPDVRIDEVPTRVHDPNSIKAYAKRLVELVAKIDDTPTYYDVKGNLPLKN